MITITDLGLPQAGFHPLGPAFKKPAVNPAAGSFTTAPSSSAPPIMLICPDGSVVSDPSQCAAPSGPSGTFTTNPNAGPASSTQPPATVTCPDGSTATDLSLCPSGYVAPTLTLCPDGFTQVTDPSTCPQPTSGATATISPGPIAVTSSDGAPALVPVVGAFLPATTGLSPFQMFGLAALGLAAIAGIAYAVKHHGAASSSRPRTAPAI